MQNPFGQIGELKKMRDEAKRIQTMLAAEVIDVEKHGVEIRISGDQKIHELDSHDKSDNDIKDAVNEAIKKSQEVAAKKLAGMQGGLGGMLGGGS